jgi:hypothetical protein
MHTISASEIKQNSVRLQEALRDDILITKRDKPFVVVMDYEKYLTLGEKSSQWEYWNDTELDNFGKIAIGLSKHDYEDYSSIFLHRSKISLALLSVDASSFSHCPA